MAKPECPLCGGTGWKTVERAATQENLKRGSREMPVGAAQAGETSANARKQAWAVPCDCTGTDRTGRAMARARIPTRYKDRDFDNFETNIYVDAGQYEPSEAAIYDRSLGRAKLATEGFAREYPVGSAAGLLLMGGSGTGKTHLAIAALRELIGRGHHGLYYDYADLLRSIQNSYDSNSQTTELELIRPVLECEVLVIDELGSIKPSDWVREMIAHILNTRYNAHLTTILTTMYRDEEATDALTAGPNSATGSPPPKKFRLISGEERTNPTVQDTLEKRVGQHIRSRLYEMCRTVELLAPDYRRIRQVGRVRS